jgi:hypothetical protein
MNPITERNKKDIYWSPVSRRCLDMNKKPVLSTWFFFPGFFLRNFHDQHDEQDDREPEHHQGEQQSYPEHFPLSEEKTNPPEGYKTDQIVKNPAPGIPQFHK